MATPAPKSASEQDLARYSRQMRCAAIGVDGQRRLKHSVVTLVGCGALGGTLASTLVRAGIGALRIIDRDFIALDNLQRQTLFDEHDIAQSLPKAEAAARKLRRANSNVEVEAVVADAHAGNIEQLCGEMDLLLDGTDNLETRYLLNDVAVKRGVPWVCGACLGTAGFVLPVVPGVTPCLRCVWPEPPEPGSVPTCDVAGVLAATAQVVASFQSVAALKLLIGAPAETLGGLLHLDVWTGRVRTMCVDEARAGGDCPCCQQRRLDFLAGGHTAAAAVLCGRDAVQITPPVAAELDLRTLQRKLPAVLRPRGSEHLLQFHADHLDITLFADGRAIMQGTTDTAVARAAYARYVGT